MHTKATDDVETSHLAPPLFQATERKKVYACFVYARAAPEKRGRVSLQNYGFCIGTYRENKSCRFSNLQVNIKNPAVTFFMRMRM